MLFGYYLHKLVKYSLTDKLVFEQRPKLNLREQGKGGRLWEEQAEGKGVQRPSGEGIFEVYTEQPGAQYDPSN